MEFKEALKADLKNTFHNTKEFAQESSVYYDGESLNGVPVIITGISKDRKKSASDHETGLFVNEVKAFINAADMTIQPRKNHNIDINNVEYSIIDVKEDMGQYVLTLEVIDE